MTFLRGALALCTLLVTGCLAAAAEPLGSPEQGLVVLRSGQVLTGQVEKQGTHYIITVAAGAKVYLPAGEVDLHCRTIDEAYQRKREYVSPDSARQHLDLADWCLRNGLQRKAAEQISAAVTVDPDEPRIAAVERRLRESLEKPPTEKTALKVAATAKADDLEKVMREVPAGAVERFTNNVQPILLNRCSTSSCHGTNSKSTFKLLRPAAGDSITRRYTQRNLYAVLQVVDKAAPEASPLLTAPRGVHGNATAAIFGHREERQYEQLMNWVKQVAEPPEHLQAYHSRPRESRYADDELPSPRTHLKPESIVPNSTGRESIRGKDTGQIELAPTTASGSRNESPPRNSKPPPREPASDPFDPELFNRRFFGEKE